MGTVAAARADDLAALDHCSQPTMTTQVRRLEDAGMVTRTADPDDARAVLIRITADGVAALRQARADRGAAVDPYLERLDDTDRATLTQAVDIMRRLVEDEPLADLPAQDLRYRLVATLPIDVAPSSPPTVPARAPVPGKEHADREVKSTRRPGPRPPRR